MRGFSFAPPADEGWEAIPRLKTDRAEFANRDGDNLLWARASSFEVTGGADAEAQKVLETAESAAVFRQVRGLGHDAQVVWTRAQAEEIAGAQCLRSRALLKNKAAYSLSSSVLCSHPDRPGYIVVLEYSRRWREPAVQHEDALDGETFLNSVEFGPLQGFNEPVISQAAKQSYLASQY